MKEQRKMIKCLNEQEVPMEFRGSDLEKLFGRKSGMKLFRCLMVLHRWEV